MNVTNATTTTGTNLSNITSTVAPLITTTVNSITSNISNITTGTVAPLITTTVNSITSNISNITTGTVAPVITTTVNSITSNISNITSTVAPIITTTVNNITSNISNITTGTVAPVITTTVNNITSNISNTTNGTSPVIPLTFPLWFKIGLVIVGVLAIFGNGIVIYFIIAKHRLHTKTNFMVISLAVSDLLVGLFLVPSFLACMYEPCNDLLAKLFYDAFLFVSVANLCCITFDRFLAVTRPLRYHMKMTRRAVITMIAVSWIVPSIVSLVPVTWLYSNTNVEKQTTNNKIFFTIQVAVFMFCPCLIMLIAYAVIYNIAWKQTRHIRHVMRSVSSVSNGPRSNSIPTSSTREAKATLKVFGTVVLVFVACWSISGFRTIVSQYQLMEVPWNVTNASRLLLVANSAINPIIYALWKKDIRNEIKKLLKLNSQLVRPSSATFRSSQDLSHYDSRSSIAESNSSDQKQKPIPMNPKTIDKQHNASDKRQKKTDTKDKERNATKEMQLSNGVVNEGLTSVENVEIKTVEDKATSTRPGETVTCGIDNLVANTDGLV